MGLHWQGFAPCAICWHPFSSGQLDQLRSAPHALSVRPWPSFPQDRPTVTGSSLPFAVLRWPSLPGAYGAPLVCWLRAGPVKNSMDF